MAHSHSVKVQNLWETPYFASDFLEEELLFVTNPLAI